MALKSDMSKAYDRVEWTYLIAIMEKLGFGKRCIDLIMQCVSTVKYLVLVNGHPGTEFKPSRGLRHGDPLSPYLFLLCAEGLSSLVYHAEEIGARRGVSMSKRGTSINYQLFADDFIIFCKASMQQWRIMKQRLEKYEKASRQKLNMQKTSIFFNTNTKVEVKEELAQDIVSRICGDAEKQRDVLGAKASSGSSQVWISMGYGYLIEEGMRWRVGNGENIKIWGDKWLPTPTTHMVQSQVETLLSEAKIKGLIDEKGGWNSALIDEVMCAEEVVVIKHLPINRRGSEDRTLGVKASLERFV
ncbi:hypothetical protein F2P56_024369 [Juglans regia]|uniref:Uncharacterized protein LOC109000319 n=2 Tax=Juglans regia TaxID=51240 RepID=A0A2I4FM13_JUGRE|nr:uncharacterized protein LOC109000319 [Juglans regia]KAF5454723.1 hypothetical protein F2P56_024369 [Juglans regia]